MQILVGILIPPLGLDLGPFATIVFLLLYGIFQLVVGKAEARKKAAAAPRKPRPPQPIQVPGKAAAPANQPPNQADALRREVEDFLRRAQGQPPKKEEFAPVTQVAPSPQQPPQRLVVEQKQPKRRRRPTQATTPKSDLRSEGVAEHVSRHVKSTQIAQHAEHLGDELRLADDRMESHLHEKFDQQLGSLSRQQVKDPAVSTQKTDVAAQIAELLRKPEGMRQLIVAQEILRRPDRW